MKKLNLRKHGPLIGTLAGSAAGAVYFAVGESGVPKESNASYLSPALTDIAAWIFGGLVVCRGYVHGDGLLTFIGSSVISIHVSQFAAHKVIKNRIAE